MQPTVATNGEQWMRQTERRIGSLERKPISGTYWDHAGADGFQRASSTTSQTGTFGGNLVYNHAQISLGEGIWRVQGSASTMNTVLDHFAVGIWNATTSTLVPDSLGTATQSSTDLRGSGLSQPVILRVAETVALRVYVARNGASMLTVSSSSSAPAVWLQAERIQ